MKYLISGHRLFKLQSYDINWIKMAIEDVLLSSDSFGVPATYCYSGMASGVDLWFCQTCLDLSIPYCACIPFDEQGETMGGEESDNRDRLISSASLVIKAKNSFMVEKAEAGIIVWDGNKGGTHNVVQQMVEKQKPFIWVNPVSRKIWRCF